MTNTINGLFGATNEAATTNARSLNGTAELTNLSTKLASKMIQTMDAAIEEYRPRVAQSAVSNDELDKLIDELVEVDEQDISFLFDIDSATLTNILRSQQSKRSRTKSKQLTMVNYHTMVAAAIAENILRTVMGKPKHAGGNRATGGAVDYTVEQLEALAANQDELRKAIRNVQSKKSIMKSKAEFSESDERWRSLLKVERQLKDLRDNTTTHVVYRDAVREEIVELFGGLLPEELNKLKSAEAHELLRAIYDVVLPEQADAE